MPVPFKPNPILSADTIKYGHWYQYPPDTEYLHGYLEARKVFRGIDKMTWFGLLYPLMSIAGQFFQKKDIEDAQVFFDTMNAGKPTLHMEGRGSFGEMFDLYGGRLPLLIHATPEGTVLPVGNVAMTIESLDPRFAWLVTWVETRLMKVWYPCMTATKTRALKEIIHAYLVKSGTPETLRNRLSDGGGRSATSDESQAIGGMGHLVNFDVTTNLHAIDLARQLYNCPIPTSSLHGMEHSTITSWGREGEDDAYANMLDKNPDGGITIVGDSWSINRVLKHAWGEKFKPRILERNGVFFARLDSGTPSAMVAHAAQVICDTFGTVKNAKGFNDTTPKVRLLQSESVNLDTTPSIYEALTGKNFSSDLVNLLSGNAILQDVSRDMMSMAFKLSYGEFGGKGRNIRKEPDNEPGKWSKAGRLKLVVGEHGHLNTERVGDSERPTLLREVFRMGEVRGVDEMPVIRDRSWKVE